MGKRIVPETLKEMKQRNEPIAMLTCYDFPTALCLDTAGIDIAFIGDSVGTNILGYQSPQEVTMEDMVHHTKAVRRGIKNALVLTDMPYKSFENPTQALENAQRLINAGAEMVKLEGGRTVVDIIKNLSDHDIPVLSHIGYTPQTASGDKIVVGAKANEALDLYKDAQALEAAGALVVLLECVPERVSEVITSSLSVPTIGIGSGKYCDGQVLVVTDLLGWNNLPLRFLKRYAQFSELAGECFTEYIEDVKHRTFPSEEHIFRLKKEELEAFKNAIERDGG